LGRIFYYIIPIRKKVAAKNIQLCFPGITKEGMNKILKDSYTNVLTVIFEFFYLQKLNDKKLKKFVIIDDAEFVHKKLKKGKGLIIISAHFGNWELMAQGCSRIFGEPFNIIVKEQTNKKIDLQINKIRESNGNRMIGMKSPRDVLKILNDNKVLAILGDQSAPSENSVKVNFFVPDVPMFEGPARFAIKTEAEVFVGLPFRNDDGSYTVKITDIDMNKYKDYTEENIKALTQEHSKILEDAIHEQPGSWLWFHRKFKSILNYN